MPAPNEHRGTPYPRPSCLPPGLEMLESGPINVFSVPSETEERRREPVALQPYTASPKVMKH